MELGRDVVIGDRAGHRAVQCHRDGGAHLGSSITHPSTRAVTRHADFRQGVGHAAVDRMKDRGRGRRSEIAGSGTRPRLCRERKVGRGRCAAVVVNDRLDELELRLAHRVRERTGDRRIGQDCQHEARAGAALDHAGCIGARVRRRVVRQQRAGRSGLRERVACDGQLLRTRRAAVTDRRTNLRAIGLHGEGTRIVRRNHNLVDRYRARAQVGCDALEDSR